MFRFWIYMFFVIVMVLPQNLSGQSSELRIGTKAFTESVLLGEVVKQLLESEGHITRLYPQLGGTRINWSAIVAGEIDIYPDYTGTITEEILAERSINSLPEMRAVLKEFGIGMTQPLGFNNTYALGLKNSKAEALGIESISDLRQHNDLRFGFSNEFMDRRDGWPGLRNAYSLQPSYISGLDHDLAYRGIEADNIDVIDLYSTDPEIQYYDLKVLRDDLEFFPDYEAVILYRLDLNEEVVTTLEMLEGTIPDEEMIEMNAAVKMDRIPDIEVASAFLNRTFGIETEFVTENLTDRLLKNTIDHLYLVIISLTLAILIAIPLGIFAVKIKSLETAILGMTGILQTIPSLALLVFMIPIFGIGALPAMAALFLYSLLPIVRNTHSGIREIPKPMMESARALGIPNSLILRKIELPLAIPSILAGIKTSAVINVGVATLGALIGAGGYGQPILTGIRLDSVPLILEGAIPAAVLALLVQAFFDLIERILKVVA